VLMHRGFPLSLVHDLGRPPSRFTLAWLNLAPTTAETRSVRRRGADVEPVANRFLRPFGLTLDVANLPAAVALVERTGGGRRRLDLDGRWNRLAFRDVRHGLSSGLGM